MKSILLVFSFLALVVLLNGCTGSEFIDNKDQIMQNPSFCENYKGDQRNWCYTFAANIRGDPDPCLKIKSNEIKEKCFEEVASEINDPEKCEKSKTDDEKDGCYYTVARYRGDISFCEKISVGPYGCYSGVATKTLNVDLCEDSRCVMSIAAFVNKPELCRDIPNGKFRADVHPVTVAECLADVAEDNGDADLCLEIKERDSANDCFRNVAIVTKDITLCKYIDEPQEWIEWNCYSFMAIDDYTQCGKINDLTKRNGCYSYVAWKSEDPSICKNIVIKGVKDMTCKKYYETLGVRATVPKQG